jgi:ssDNA-binding Zn-finger/Zn-ribbon topoisomerase 1
MDLEKTDKMYHDLSSWRRGMTAKTIFLRYSISEETLKNYATSSDSPPGVGRCPECGAGLMVKEIELADDAKTKVYFLQCRLNTKDPNHGFGKFSRHGVRAPMGRPPRGEEKKAPEKAPDPMPNPDVPKDKVVHPEILRAAKFVQAGIRNLYFSGPAGTGKSTGSEMLWEILKGFEAWKDSSFYLTTVGMGTFVETLSGYKDRLDGGKYVSTDLVESLQKPGLTVVDEADKGNPNLAGFWNTVLASNLITTPGGVFNRHKDNVVVFIGNTTGHAPNKQYSGSVRQDFATLDRFKCFNIDFNESVERAAISNLSEDLYNLAKKIRKAAETSGLQRIIGLRWLSRVNVTMKVDGLDAKKAIKQVMRDECWSEDEVNASGIDVEEKKVDAPSKSKYY